VHAHAQADGEPAGRQLLDDLQIHRVRLPAAAVLLRVGQAEQPGAAQRAEDLAGEPPGLLFGGGARRELGRDQVAGQVEKIMGLRRRQVAFDARRTGPAGGGAVRRRRGAARRPVRRRR
jgi:hypothetical protein